MKTFGQRVVASARHKSDGRSLCFAGCSPLANSFANLLLSRCGGFPGLCRVGDELQ